MTTAVSDPTRGALDDAEMLEMHAHQLELVGDDMLAIRQMERALLIRCQAADGTIDLDRCVNACERLVVKCNTAAVKAFKGDDYNTGTLLLENALRLTEENSQPLSLAPELRQRLRGTTLNNYGCLERRRGRLEMALNFMRLSLSCAGQQSPATYLNISAIQLQLGQNQEAIGSARRSIGLLESIPSDYPGMIAVAYHNLAMALEGTDQAACLHAYETAYSHALRDLGRQSLTTQSIEKNLNRFRSKHVTTTSSKQCVTLPALTQRSEPYSVLPHPFVPAQVRQPVSAPRRRESAPPSPKKPTILAPVKEKEQSQKGVPKPPTAPQPSRLAPARSGAARTSSEKQKQPEKDPETPRADREKVEAKDGKEDSKKPKIEKPKDESSKAASPALNAQEEAHRSDDVVAFLHNRLCTLIQAEEQFEVRFRMATKIQCMTRCHFARKALSFKRRERVKAATLRDIRDSISARIVTRFFKQIAARAKQRKQAAKLESQQLSVKTKAASKIQRVARKWLKQRRSSRARKFGVASTRALRVLQCWFRQCLARKEVNRLRAVALETQKAVLYREQLERAATDLQRVFRAHVVSRIVARSRGERYALKEKEKQSRREGSAVRIQALIRGVKDRRRFAVIKHNATQRELALRRLEDHRNAAITLQAWAKGLAARALTAGALQGVKAKRAEAVHMHRCRAATVIQCLFRRASAITNLKKRKAARELQRTSARDAARARLIQCACRGFRSRSELSAAWLSQLRTNAVALLTEAPEVSAVEPIETVQEEKRETAAEKVTVPPESAVVEPSNPPQVPAAEVGTITAAEEPPVDKIDTPAKASADTEAAPLTEVVAHEDTMTGRQENESSAVAAPTSESLPEAHAEEISEKQEEPEPKVPETAAPAAVSIEPPIPPVVEPQAPPPVKAAEFVPKPPVRPPSVESRIAHQVRRDAKRIASASAIQRVFRGHIDRAYSRKLRQLVAEYVDELTEKYRCDVEPTTPFNFHLLNTLSSGLDQRIESTRQERRAVVVQQFVAAKLSEIRGAEAAQRLAARRQDAILTIQRLFRFVKARSAVRARRASAANAARVRSDAESAAFEKLSSAVDLVQSLMLARMSAQTVAQRLDQVRLAAAESIRNFALVVTARKELSTLREQEAAKREAQAKALTENIAIVTAFLLEKRDAVVVSNKRRHISACKIQRLARRCLSRRKLSERRAAVNKALAAMKEEDEAATVIQGAYRMATARAEVAARKNAKAEKWQNLQESEEAPVTAVPPAADEDVVEAASAAASKEEPIEHIDPQAGRDAAAVVIQRNARKMAAKQKANELREENRKKWEDKRRLAEQEEAVDETLLS